MKKTFCDKCQKETEQVACKQKEYSDPSVFPEELKVSAVIETFVHDSKRGELELCDKCFWTIVKETLDPEKIAARKKEADAKEADAEEDKPF
jgi:hypothetical protein